MNIKCFAITTLFWGFMASITYGIIITKQMLIIPNQPTYMHVSNDLSATPTAFSVSPNTSSEQLDALVKEVTR